MVKKLTVIGIIGKTQGVNKAANPEKKAIINIDHNPISSTVDSEIDSDLIGLTASAWFLTVVVSTSVFVVSATNSLAAKSVVCEGIKNIKLFSKLIQDYLDQKSELKPLYNHFPTLENFEKQIAEKVHEVLENVDLVDSLNKMPSALSGGMRKRISLARTIVVDPLIMLYDEPTTGLDPVTSDEIRALILDVQKKYKTSSIIITHDIKCALHTANRMIMLRDGVVFMEGKPEEFKQSTDEYIQSFSFQ